MGDVASLLTAIAGLVTAFAGAYALIRKERQAEADRDELRELLREARRHDDDQPKR